MPRIPLLNQPKAPSTAVDLGVQPNRGGAVALARETAQLGGVIQQFGTTLLEKRKQAEISTFTSKSSMDFGIESQKWQEELKTKYADNPNGYTQEYQERVDSWFSERSTQAPNDDARDLFERNFNNEKLQQFTQANSWEKQQVAKNYISDINVTANGARQMISKNPDTASAASLFVNQLKMVEAQKGISYDKSQADKLSMELGTQYTDSLLDGFMSSKQYAAGLKFINGEDKAGIELLKYADADKLAHFRERFNAGIESESFVGKRLYNKSVGDVTAGLLDGMNVPSDRVRSLKESANALPELERNYVIDNLNNAELINNNLQTIKTLPLDKAEAMVKANVIPQGEDPTFNLESRMQYQNLYQKKAEEIIKKRREDPISFYSENDQSFRNLMQQASSLQNPQAMSEYVTVAQAKQEADGVGFKRLVTDSMATSYKSMLTSSDPNISVGAEQAIRAGYGDKAGMVFSEIAMKDKAFEPYAVAFSVENLENKKDLLNKIRNQKEIDTAFQQSQYKSSDIKTVYNEDDYQEFTAAIAMTDPTGDKTWVRNGVGKLIELEMKDQLSKGVSVKEAKKSAVKKVISDNYDIASSHNSKVLVPKKLKSMDVVEDFIADFSLPGSFKSFGVATPANYGANLADKEKLDERYLQDLSKNAVWVSNGSQDGMYLAKKSPSGGLEKVTNAQGKLINIKFSEMDVYRQKGKNASAQ